MASVLGRLEERERAARKRAEELQAELGKLHPRSGRHNRCAEGMDTGLRRRRHRAARRLGRRFHRHARPEHLAQGDAAGRPQGTAAPRRPVALHRPRWAAAELTCFTTDTKGGQLADLELRHRRRARCEDRIRGARDTGLRNLPLHDTAQHRIRLEIVSLALDLLAWMPMLALTGKGTQTASPAAVLRSRSVREHRPPPLAALHGPMALDRRHHSRDRQAPHPPEPRLTSHFHHPDNPHHRTGDRGYFAGSAVMRGVEVVVLHQS